MRSLLKGGGHLKDWGKKMTLEGESLILAGETQERMVKRVEDLMVQLLVNSGGTQEPTTPPTVPTSGTIPIPTIKPTHREDRTGKWDAEWRLKAQDQVSNTHFTAGHSLGFLVPVHGEEEAAKQGWRRTEPVSGIRITNSIIEGDGTTYWLFRGYDMDGVVVDTTIWRNAGDEGRNDAGEWTEKDEGHAIYLNLFGSLLVHDSHFEDLLGQAIQLVWGGSNRYKETNLHGPRPARTVELINVTCLNCGHDDNDIADRASFPISFKGIGQSVSMEGVVVRSDDDFKKWWNHRTERWDQSRGGVLVGLEGDRGRPTPHLGIRGLEIDIINSDREAVKLERIDNVDWVGGHVQVRGEGRQASINIYPDCPMGRISDVDGDFVVMRITPGSPATVVATGPLLGSNVYEWKP